MSRSTGRYDSTITNAPQKAIKQAGKEQGAAACRPMRQQQGVGVIFPLTRSAREEQE